MAHVTTDLMDQLISDLSQPNAFPAQSAEVKPAPETTPTSNPKQLVHFPHVGRGFR